MVTAAFATIENCLTFALLSLAFWVEPDGDLPALAELASGTFPAYLAVATPIAYAIVVVFLEPCYVGAGFGIYLSRRAELEAWDIEQEFRRAFA